MDIQQFNEKMKRESEIAFPERRIVFGDGRKNADIMLIGEAPGGEEEKQGRPFVGKAGKNLTEFLDALSIEREQVYISNVVKLRPTKPSPKTGKPVNRPPNKEELAFFVPRLLEEIELINPKIIVTLGNFSLKNVMGDNKIVIGDCHGTLTEKDGKKVFPLFHPAAIIYNRALTDVYFEDLRKLKNVLEEM
jgi:DNA polymerase